MSANQTTPKPASTDHVELRAAEIAKREGRSEVTNEDRKRAMEELRKTAPPVPPGEEASH